MKITAKAQAGMFFGQVDGKTVCGPYMNRGLAIRQAKTVVANEAIAAHVAETAAHNQAIRAARIEGRKMGMTNAEIQRFIARQS